MAPPFPPPGNAELRLYSITRHHLIGLSTPIRETLSKTPYNPPEGASVSIKSLIESLLPSPNLPAGAPPPADHREMRDFCLCCAALASAEGDESPAVYWIPKDLSSAANSAFRDLSISASYRSNADMIADLMPEVMPLLKALIKESCVDPTEEEVAGAANKETPVGQAILAAHQLRWLVTEVGYPDLGKLCQLVIPCALTTLDHWSPEVKDQGMLSFIHLAKNVTGAELSWYEDAILDVCCRNIVSSDELWHRIVEMSVLLLTYTQRGNPRSFWFERVLNEMLSHLERQPLNKERRVAWLQLIEPVFDAMGLVILAHFRRIFYLFFQWLHADDDNTLLLVFERLRTIIKLTWIRKSPYFERLVDELALLYKETSMRKSREAIRDHIRQLLILIQECKGQQFEVAWDKHKNDVDLSILTPFVGNHQEVIHSSIHDLHKSPSALV